MSVPFWLNDEFKSPPRFAALPGGNGRNHNSFQESTHVRVVADNRAGSYAQAAVLRGRSRRRALRWRAVFHARSIART
jgi:hypothetical protein